MCEVKKIKSAEMFPVIKEILDGGGRAWITVTGMSMYPFLREDEDSVELSSASIDTIKRGDIVLIKRVTGEYILHRVLRTEKDSFYIIGDAQQWVEGPLAPEQLVAVVTAVKRNKHQFTCQSKFWVLLVKIWINVIPLRHLFLKGIRFFAKAKKVIIHAQA
ncbi:S24/S26 family peptidase [Ruminiclostridium herbifermentans]|uniref:S24/S26 family peptidase n=1 Tax=Ruminiclostridium herbifermentans TaxID=2488810 RepID=A0A4U7JHV9_9FIRM|nr:S24/S26 family peptidase [Ruminiclostridium herbifermentans]QNU66612.1 S24/S26 family peptidase [Ruminiclostridium herbifermentans]